MQNRERYSDTLPKKYMAAGALLFNEAGELLILHPTYKNRWEIVGGIVEADESPRSGCEREIREEIGLNVNVGLLLCLDYSINLEGVENLQFIFDGGVLSRDQIANIRLADGEVKSLEFLAVSTHGDRERLRQRDRLGPRLVKALEARENKTAYYLEKGVMIDRGIKI